MSNSNLELINNDNKDLNKNDFSQSKNKNKIYQEKIDKIPLKSLNTMKFDNAEKDIEKKMETIQEDTFKANRIYRGRRFYKNRQENIKTISINDK